MGLSVDLLAAAVLATAEFCASPIDGGVGEPQFCSMNSHQEISTPYFSITVEPGFLVGVHHQGRRLQVQSTLWGSPNSLTAEVHDGSTPPAWPDCPEIAETVEANVTWQNCRISAPGSHQRRLVAILKGHHVLIQYTYTALGATTGPALERMLQSIRILAI